MPLVSPFVHSIRLIHLEDVMKILRALGSGLFLLILALLMPTVFSELSKTLVVFLQSSAQAFTAAGILAASAGHIPAPLH